MTSALASGSSQASAMCFPIVGTKGVRMTAINGCGKPMYGPNSQAVSTGVVSIELEPETEDGEEYSQKNAAGEQCFPAFTGPSSIKWWNLTIEFCQIDPELFALMCPNWPGVRDWSRTRNVGWRMGSKITSDATGDKPSGFALETWPKSAGAGVAQVCYDDTSAQPEPGGYFLLPWCVPDAPDSFTLEDGPATFTIKAKTKPGSLWMRGPYDVVVNDAQGTAGPLVDPIDPGFRLYKPGDDPNGVTGFDATHFHGELTTVKPPDFKAIGCGTHGLWDKSATPATITVEDGGTTEKPDKTKPKITVSNLTEVGGSGTVYWGDGERQPVTSTSPVEKTNAYADALFGTELTVEFQSANNATPATAKYTPQQNPARGGRGGNNDA